MRALARQWFGVWIRPKIPADEWLLEGLAGYLENLFVAKYLGRNELLYRYQHPSYLLTTLPNHPWEYYSCHAHGQKASSALYRIMHYKPLQIQALGD